MKWNLQCTICGEKFSHRGQELPDECPVCHGYIGVDGKPEVAAPRISLSANRSPDKMYRDMEKGAEHRINLAAEHTGLPASEFSDMKHTNMLDNRKEGETSFIPHQMPQGMTASFDHGHQPEQIANYKANIASGPHARQGASQISTINNLHARHGGAIIRGGQQARG